MKGCDARSDRRTSAGDAEVARLHLLWLVDRQVQKDQQEAEMEPYSTYAEIVLFFAFVGLIFSLTMIISLVWDVMKCLKSR